MDRRRRSASVRARHTKEIHLEWGPRAVEAFEGWADVVVVVDVLSFSSAVDVAV